MQIRQALVCVQAFICIATYRTTAAQVHRILYVAKELYTNVKALYHLSSRDL